MTGRQFFIVVFLAACPIGLVSCVPQQSAVERTVAKPSDESDHAAKTTPGAVGLVGATLFVDAVNGNDSTGRRGRSDLPFATLAGAYGAIGVAAGDVIYLGPGTFSIATTQVIPNSISVWGAGQGITILSYTGKGGLLIQPGSDSIFGNLSIVNGTGNPTANFFPIGFALGSGGSTAISNNVTVMNLTISTFSDGFFFNGNGVTTTPVYWKLINCTISTSWDCVTIIPADDNAPGPPAAWPFHLDLINCYYNTTFVDKSALNCRGLHIEGPPGFGGPVVRDFGGVFNINGDPADNKPTHAVSATNVTIELHGSTISSTGASHLYSSGAHGLIKVGPDTDFDPTKITLVNDGKVAGYVAQILGTGGTTVAAGAAAGTGATAVLTPGSDDSHGQISITTGTDAATGTLATVTFGSGKANSFPVLAPANAAAQNLTGGSVPGIGTSSGSSFTIVTGSNAFGSSAGPYLFNYAN
ncbi:MAG TPA: hypothetical protein VHY91_27735 [Pirellulales bacterium]|nr:hypothetical protein [Pirellulales bacterium]